MGALAGDRDGEELFAQALHCEAPLRRGMTPGSVVGLGLANEIDW